MISYEFLRIFTSPEFLLIHICLLSFRGTLSVYFSKAPSTGPIIMVQFQSNKPQSVLE